MTGRPAGDQRAGEVLCALAALRSTVGELAARYEQVAAGFTGAAAADRGLLLGLVDELHSDAAEALGAAAGLLARRGWVLSGAPLRCGSCGEHIRLGIEPWQVCDGWAEHLECHVDDQAGEVLRRADQRAEDEWAAQWEDRHRHGPAEGDLVVVTAGGSRVEGVWTVAGGRAGVLGRDGRFHRPDPAGAVLEVLGLAGDW